MTTHARHPDSLPLTSQPLEEPAPPAWLESRLNAEAAPADMVHRNTPIREITTRVQRGPQATLVTARVKGAREVRDGLFGELTAAVYAVIRSALRDSAATQPSHPHVVRMWNFIPGILDRMSDGEARYMTFNAGRFAALSDWLGGPRGIAAHAPAASGVGHLGADLVVHALAIGREGRSVENPAQTPAYHYSPRWGRVPPCFARATALDDSERTLLLSGTAAVIGEESVYPGDARAQWDATLTNISRLIDRANANGPEATGHRIDHARVYFSRPDDEFSVREWAAGSFPDSQSIEIVPAQLCRSELLVEIEAVASVSSGPAVSVASSPPSIAAGLRGGAR